jgi:hypothetical protein
MADVKICDRCGKIIEDHRVRRNVFKERYYGLFSPDIRELTSSWDLCHDCGVKLARFLKNDDNYEDQSV